MDFRDQLCDISYPTYVNSIYHAECDNTYLMHHGVKGMHWGVRRYRNYDGTLTSAGRKQNRAEKRAERKAQRAEIKRYKQGAKMVANKSDSIITKRAKNDYNNLSEGDFRRKYLTSKKTYAKRVVKSPTGDPFADTRNKMSANRFDKAVNREADYRTSVHLAEKAERINSNRSAGSKFVTTLATGRRGNTAYNTARAAGDSKLKATASTSLLGSEATMKRADRKYKNSAEGRRYTGRVKSDYYR